MEADSRFVVSRPLGNDEYIQHVPAPRVALNLTPNWVIGIVPNWQARPSAESWLFAVAIFATFDLKFGSIEFINRITQVYSLRMTLTLKNRRYRALYLIFLHSYQSVFKWLKVCHRILKEIFTKIHKSDQAYISTYKIFRTDILLRRVSFFQSWRNVFF